MTPRSDSFIDDLMDDIVDRYRKEHPTLGEMELWQFIKSRKVNGKSIPPHEIAAALRRTKPQ